MAAPEVPDWTRVVLLSGIDPSGDPITIAVDADGNIIAVMKGEYAGALKTAAVDASGRFIVIPTDPADVWGNAISMGNAELAARLTGQGLFDRRGSIIKFDNFEAGLSQWAVNASGTGVTPSLSSTASKDGKFSAVLDIGAGGAGDATLEAYIPYPVLTNLGLEVSFSLLNNNYNNLQIQFAHYDGTNAYNAIARVKPSPDKVVYVDSGGVEQNLVTNINLLENIHCFNTIKVVIDPDADTWVRALLNEQEVATTVALYPGASVGSKYIYVRILFTGDATSANTAYIDSVRVTQDEPV